MILTLKAALRVWGFGKVLQWIGQRVRSVPQCQPLAPESVRATEQSVAMAGALYPGRALCLEQSLVLYYLLRRRGVQAEYCQGVIPAPFEAHAWVEYQGTVLNDIDEHARRYVRLPRQLP
ncbi:MAG: lasso peptide biosynthesis B2 protein [Gemmatimonadales bacterium]